MSTFSEKIEKYKMHGVGYDCNTYELKNLKRQFLRKNIDSRKLINDLTFLEQEKEKYYKINIENEIKDIEKEINLIIIALSYNDFESFLKSKI